MPAHADASHPTWDVFADHWLAVDALGRVLPRPEDCPPRPGRHVGMFYFLTHKPGGDGPHDVSKIIAANPADPAFLPNKAHHWGEPEFGTYASTDPWVIRRHGEMLADAGVDTIIFDVTNDVSFPEVTDAIVREWSRMRREGERTPQFCYLASKESVRQVWEHVYKPRRHEELWFQWKGRPVLLFGQHIGMGAAEDFPEEIQRFFTLRASWAWDSLPWYRDGQRQWPWVVHHPQCIGWDKDRAVPEQVPVATGQHPLSNIGRSFHDGAQPPTDEQFLCDQTPLGLCFQEQWERAHDVGPEFVFVTGWNEWTAGCVVMGEDVQKCLEHWCFFPGAQLGLAGRALRPGDKYFIDQFNQEFSRDIEPMRGGHRDNYYRQLVANVRRYKGARPLSAPFAASSAAIEGAIARWDSVPALFRNHLGDGAARDWPGVGSTGQLTRPEATNRIVHARVAHDDEAVLFLVETRDVIRDVQARDGMLLFINADGDHATGWEGFDVLVNLDARADGTTSIHTWRDGLWQPVARVPMEVRGTRLAISVPPGGLP